MKKHDDYSHVSCLIVAYLTGKLSMTERDELEAWVNASDDHLHMMADFTSVCWHARETRSFEEPDKMVSWHLIQEKVACRAGALPLPDLEVREWMVGRRAGMLWLFKVMLMRGRTMVIL